MSECGRMMDEKDEQISALQQQVERLTALNDIAVASMRFSKETSDTLSRHLDAIAEALHPHKPKDGGWTYLPDQLPEMVAALKRENDKLKSAVDTIPAAVMLLGGPPYKLTFTEACIREIAESQK